MLVIALIVLGSIVLYYLLGLVAVIVFEVSNWEDNGPPKEIIFILGPFTLLIMLIIHSFVGIVNALSFANPFIISNKLITFTRKTKYKQNKIAKNMKVINDWKK